MKIYKTEAGILLEHGNQFRIAKGGWDELVNRENLFEYLDEQFLHLENFPDGDDLLSKALLPPIGSQEVWAAGVTYFRSKEARMDESRETGGASFYDKVYEAERPELFFKSNPHRVAGHRGVVNIREDSTWNVPEPELTLFINSKGNIQGYTVGNDVSSRSIEGENPLYLPQAKTYERSAALGPCLLVLPKPIEPFSVIQMEITRGGESLYKDSVAINKMKRTHTELASFLFRATDFVEGAYLMTGTCLVPSSDFTLQAGDQVSISIQFIGTLINTVAVK